MLDDISAVKTWDKVNSGMIKMFTAEVLGRLPVVQHFLFGSLLPPPPSLEDADSDDVEIVHHGDHSHVKQKKTVGEVKGEMFGDCCGIPVPVRTSRSTSQSNHTSTAADSSRFVTFAPFAVCLRSRSGCAQERQGGRSERDHRPRTQSGSGQGTHACRLAMHDHQLKEVIGHELQRAS